MSSSDIPDFRMRHPTCDERSYIVSSAMEARRFAEAVRGHWGVENSLHWSLDVTFREDESRVRNGSTPDNFAVIRHICMSLLKQETFSQARHQGQALPIRCGFRLPRARTIRGSLMRLPWHEGRTTSQSRKAQTY